MLFMLLFKGISEGGKEGEEERDLAAGERGDEEEEERGEEDGREEDGEVREEREGMGGRDVVLGDFTPPPPPPPLTSLPLIPLHPPLPLSNNNGEDVVEGAFDIEGDLMDEREGEESSMEWGEEGKEERRGGGGCLRVWYLPPLPFVGLLIIPSSLSLLITSFSLSTLLSILLLILLLVFAFLQFIFISATIMKGSPFSSLIILFFLIFGGTGGRIFSFLSSFSFSFSLFLLKLFL